MIAASALSGLAVLMYAGTLLSAVNGRRRSESASLIERQRLAAVRAANPIFRWFEPLAREWRFLFPADESTRMSRLQLALDGDPREPPWTAAEFLESKGLEALLFGSAFGAIVGAVFGLIAGVATAVIVALVMYNVGAGVPVSKMLVRRRQFIRRLPYAVDLMALMMEAGATFTGALQTLAREQKDHPVGQEFSRLLAELEHGETQRAALEHFQQRLPNEEDVAELVFSIVKGQELGTPLAQILRNQADQMRLKRSQRAEKAAADAQVKMTGPAFAIMLVCMAIITAPFAMNFIKLITSGDSGLSSEPS